MTFRPLSILRKTKPISSLIAGETAFQEKGMGRVGPEHPPLKPSKTPISGKGGAKSDAHDAPNCLHDPDLAEIVRLWPKLSERTRTAIKALVETDKAEKK